MRSHAKEIPSIEGTAKQITDLLNKLDLKTVFVCTDGKDWGKPGAIPDEINELCNRKL